MFGNKYGFQRTSKLSKCLYLLPLLLGSEKVNFIESSQTENKNVFIFVNNLVKIFFSCNAEDFRTFPDKQNEHVDTGIIFDMFGQNMNNHHIYSHKSNRFVFRIFAVKHKCLNK